MVFLNRILVATTLFVLAGTASGTGSMRCGGHIVDQGMTKGEVIKACGQPTVIKEADNYWYYERGSTNLVTRLYFVGDKLEFIDDVPSDEM